MSFAINNITKELCENKSSFPDVSLELSEMILRCQKLFVKKNLQD